MFEVQKGVHSDVSDEVLQTVKSLFLRLHCEERNIITGCCSKNVNRQVTPHVDLLAHNSRYGKISKHTHTIVVHISGISHKLSLVNMSS